MEVMYHQKTRNVLFCAGFITGAMFLIILLESGLYPFGSQCILRADLYHQYAPFLAGFRRQILSGRGLSFTWDAGLGVNFAPIYAYYLASPFNWLTILVPEAFLIEFITALIFLRTILASVTMTGYLLQRSEKRPSYAAVFGIFYAMSGYMAAYYWNIMWLDCIWVFPIVCLGVEKLVKEGRCALYAAALAFSIFTNYYISIMVCFFLPFYFAAVLAMNYRGLKHAAGSFLRFTLASVLSALMAAAVVFPAALALKGTASGTFSFPDEVETYFSFIEVLSRHLTNVACEDGFTHNSWPNIYCGSAVIGLIPLYIVNRRISIREKASYFLMAVFFLLIFSVNTLNYIFHGFHFPNSLPARMSFIYIFLVLFMSFRAVEEYRGNTKRDLVGAFLCSVIFLLLAQEYSSGVENGVTLASILSSAAFLTAFFLLAYQAAEGKMRADRAAVILVGVLVVEAGFNFSMTALEVTNRSAYVENNRNVRELAEKTSVTGMERFQEYRNMIRNRGVWTGYQSPDIFSSASSAGVSDFLRALGTDSAKNYYTSRGGTPFADALLGIRYTIAPADKILDEHYKPVASSGDLLLYENPDVLPWGFVLPESIDKGFIPAGSDAAASQNAFAAALGKSALLIRNAGRSESGVFSFAASQDGRYFVMPDLMTIKEARIIRSSGEEESVLMSRHRFFLDIGYLEKGEEIRVTAKGEDESFVATDMKVYRFDYDALAAVCGEFSKNGTVFLEKTGPGLSGTVKTDAGGTIMLSVPYDNGWRLYVDGEEESMEKIFGAFLGFEILPGEHDIRLSYAAPGFRMGIIVSIFSFFLFLGAAAAERKIPRLTALAGRRTEDGSTDGDLDIKK